MVSYENLGVYKSSFDLCVYFEKIVKNFNKGNKFTIGADLKNKSREIAMQVVRANISSTKIKEIQELIILIEEQKLIVRLCQETNGFPNKNSYGYISKLLTNLTTQANNWLLCSQKREQTE
ncbi:MAG TPA: four helix bundle protein [archaeon]|nr:four helix bundle protein [archaeon]